MTGPADPRPLVLVTGGAGRVAGRIAPGLRRRFRLRLADTTAPTDAAERLGDQVVTGDLADPPTLERAVAGVAAIVHLAGNPRPGASWPVLRTSNVDLTVNVLAAATATGVGRVVLASSVHAVGAYVASGAVPIAGDAPPRPCCLYGASKAAIEAVGSVYATRHGLEVVCLRIGAATALPIRPWARRLWISPRDLAQLVTRSIAEPIGFGVFPAVSANTRGVFSNHTGRDELGYRPADDAEEHLDSIDPTVKDASGCFGPAPID